MSKRPLVIGGAAATVAAGTAALLFPNFSQTTSAERASATEFAKARGGFADALAGGGRNAGFLKALGFEGKPVPGATGTTVLAEAADDCAGKGVYWLRDEGGRELAITAPHRGSDRHTGSLAAMLFLETGARAAAWNSAPRRPTKDCRFAIDLAREESHIFSAFTLAFADTFTNGLIVQLHGFEGGRRETNAARQAAMIVSNGTEQPGEKTLGLADCLSIAFAPQDVLVYPIGTDELGALSNAQGKLLREAGHDGFVHLEISAAMRGALVQDGALRARLAQCLIESAA